jgi:phosphatidylglycerol---prolipoprotein diacylglyceryl transferase
METLLYTYHHLPFMVDPIAIRFGPFAITWYALMYLVAFTTVYFLLLRRLKNDKIQLITTKGDQLVPQRIKDTLVDYLLYSFLGLIIGARIGYVIFYDLSYYIARPWAIISPFDSLTGQFTGIYGMSYHGGLVGVAIVSLFFLRRRQLSLWQWADFIIPAIPAGYIFGRLGNFMNGELYGRVTTGWWGMYFPDAQRYGSSPPELRHPSQLYEALLEGVLLFILLWSVRNKRSLQGNLLSLYLFGYGLMRFLVEFVREPDAQIGYIVFALTMGQVLSILMMMIALTMFAWRKRRKLV